MDNSKILISSSTIRSLEENYKKLEKTHLRKLLSDNTRNKNLLTKLDNVILDYTHEKIDEETISLLEKLSDELKLMDKFDAMFRGDKINSTENRSVLHVALRKPENEKLFLEGSDIIPEVHKVLNRIKQYSESIRSK